MGKGEISEVGLQQWPGTWHLTWEGRHRQQFLSHLSPRPVGGAFCTVRATQRLPSVHREQLGAVGGWLCSTERVRCPLVPTGGRDWPV